MPAGGKATPEPTDQPSDVVTPTEPDPTPSAVLDPEHAMDPPGRVETPLLPADIMVIGSGPLPASLVKRISRLEGVAATTTISVKQVPIENRLYDIAAVDAAEYRRFTEPRSAQFQPQWDRLAGGEVASVEELQKRLPLDSDGFLTLDVAEDAPRIHVGAYAPQVPTIELVVNEKWGETLGIDQHNALVISTQPASPQSLQGPIRRLVGEVGSVQMMDIASQLGLDPDAAQTAVLVGTYADAVGTYRYTVSGGRVIPDPAWVREHIVTATVPILGQVTCNEATDPAAEGGAGRHRLPRAGRRDPSRRLRRLLLPALHRRAHPAVQPRFRPGARHQRAGQPARHGRRDGPRSRRRLQEVGLRLGRRLGLHRPHALRAEPDRQPGLARFAPASVTGMRAAQVVTPTGPSDVQVREIEEPTPGPDDVLIEVHRVGISFPDLLLSRGEYQIKPEPPFSLGVDVAGTVVSGPGFEPGQRVAAVGGYGGAQELAAIPAMFTFPLPDNLSYDEGAALPMNYLTAQFALAERGHLQEGETVLVHGAAGGVGTATIQVAKGMGARTIAVVSTEEKAQVARDAGADEAVLVDGFKDAVKELTGGKGVDVVLDVVGGDAFTDSLRCSAPRAGCWWSASRPGRASPR